MIRWTAEPDPQTFLSDYWQRKPVLLRQALTVDDFPLDGDDLAGLACEELASARLINGPDSMGSWRLRHGPFDEQIFSDIGDRNWTLLVQDVEKHYPPLVPWLEPFNFLPRWRFDDLMLSFAAPGGSVGPHVDQYDVFLLQVEGRRHWQIACDFDDRSRDNVPLDMLADFTAERSWTLEPGDMLYLPPGVAHHGVARDPCLTLSVGFRAPSAADLFLALGETLAAESGEGGRYRDPGLTPSYGIGEIDPEAVRRFHCLLEDTLNPQDRLPAFIARFMSTYRQAQEPAPPPDLPDRATIMARVARGATLEPHPWARYAWVKTSQGQATLFASGTAFDMTPELAQWVCSLPSAKSPPLSDADWEGLLQLIRTGQLILSSNP